MTTYGLLVVDTNWTNQDSIRIDKTTHLRHKDSLVSGAKALIYVRHPVDAVVAEAELTGKVIQTETNPQESAVNPVSENAATVPNSSLVMEKTFRVPVQVTRLKGQTELIPLNQLQMILGSDFSVFDETWIPLSETQYDSIVARWEKGKR